MKRTVKYSLVSLILLAAALLAAPFFINVNHYKGLILERAEQATGRKIEMGELHASFFPWVGMRVDNVRISNPRGFPNPGFLQVKSLDVRLALLPLLSKHIEIKRFVLDSPRLMLERNADGIGNWKDLFPASRKNVQAGNVGKTSRTPVEGGGWLIALSAKSLRMLNGQVRYRDSRSGKDIVLSELDITVDDVRLDRPVHVQASGKFSGNFFSVKAEVGPLGDLSEFNIDRLPVQANIQAKSIAPEKLAAFIPVLAGLGKGTLGMDINAEQRPDGMRVTAGSLALHGAREVDMAWKIEMPKPDRMTLDHVVVRVGGEKVAEMTGTVRGIGHRLQYQVRVNTPALSRGQLSAWIPGLQALYAANSTPWEQVKLGLLAAGDTQHIELRDLQLILNDELVQASGNIQFGAAPVVRLRIASRSLHVDPWLPRPEKGGTQNQAPVHDALNIRIVPDAHAAEGAGIGKPEGVSGSEGMAKEPDLRFLKKWRVTAGLQVDHLFLYGLDMANLRATLSGKNGVFNLDPLRFELTGGQVSEKAGFIVSRYPVRWSESTKVRGVQVRPVLKAVAGTDMLSGIAQIETKLNGVGLLPDAAIRSLNGTGNALLRDGMIKGFDIAEILRNVAAHGQRIGPRQTDFSQLSGSFKVKNGVVSNDDLFMASPLFRLTGYGKINLVAMTMNYHVKPRLVGSMAGQGDTETARKGLVIPLWITGPLDAPKVKVEMDMKTLLGNVANVKDLIRKGKGGGWKNILKGVLRGGSATGNPEPSTAPTPTPAKPVDQIRQKLKGLIPGF